MNSNFSNSLGLCRRASLLSWGHDTAIDSIKKKKAKWIIVASDASDRIKREFKKYSDEEEIEILFLDETMNDLQKSIGVKTGVITINDEGFVKLLKNNL